VNRAVEAHVEGEHRLLSSLCAEEREKLAGLLRKLLLSMEGHEGATTKASGGDFLMSAVYPSRATAAVTVWLAASSSTVIHDRGGSHSA
jgi:hypothetical protein